MTASAWAACVSAAVAVVAALVAYIEARAAKRSAAAAEVALAIERARWHEERRPRLEGRVSEDMRHLELHHVGGAPVDELQVLVTHAPALFGRFAREGGDGWRAARLGIRPGGFASFELEPAKGEDRHLGGTCVLECTATSGEARWEDIAVRIDVPDGLPEPFVL